MPEVIEPGMEVTYGGKVGVVAKITGDGHLVVCCGGLHTTSVKYCRFTSTLSPIERANAFDACTRDYQRELRRMR
jgi:hypothetical protein